MYGADGLGAEFDHFVLQVRLEENWLADVGFGESFVEPLRMAAGEEQDQETGVYRLTRAGDVWTLKRRRDNSDRERRYLFSTVPRALAEFSGMCDWHQTSPESIFTRNRLCSLATAAGRITLSGNQLIHTDGGRRDEIDLGGEDECRQILREHFGIDLE